MSGVSKSELRKAVAALSPRDFAPGHEPSGSFYAGFNEAIDAALLLIDRYAKPAPVDDGLDEERLARAMRGVLDTTTRERVLPYVTKIAAEYARPRGRDGR